MKIELLVIGKTNEKYLEEGIKIYIKRLSHYTNFSLIIVKDAKAVNDIEALKKAEGQIFLSHLSKDDFVILLDEKGSEYSSKKFSKYIETIQNQSTKKLVFIVGGAFGFSDEIYQRANAKLSLSKLTFSHQMIRLFFCEQLYRAYTIIRGEKYHNE
jgi:23S rRNA (pseudouridine1915-N3)-methyltransferase